MHSPIEASSVHTPIIPCLPYFISSKPFLMMPNPYFVKCSNSVEAPSASQMAIPSTAAIPRDSRTDKPKVDGMKLFYFFIVAKIALKRSLSSSFLDGMLMYSLKTADPSFLYWLFSK